MNAATEDPTRRSQRHATELSVVIVHDGDERSATCVDLSTAGMGLRLDDPPQVGDAVLVRIHLPDGEVVTTADVVFSSAGRCGLRFRTLSPSVLMAIHAYLGAAQVAE